MSKTWGFFLVGQDMVLSQRAHFQLTINFFRVKAISIGLYEKREKNIQWSVDSCIQITHDGRTITACWL